jgi:hypothetical protein
MKRLSPWLAFAGGIIVLALAASPLQRRRSRGRARDARRGAAHRGRAAAQLGSRRTRSWSDVWRTSPLLDEASSRNSRSAAAAAEDPVLGPRLGGVSHRVLPEERQQVPAVRLRDRERADGRGVASRCGFRPEETGAHPTERSCARAPTPSCTRARSRRAESPQFESARPNVLRTRTDWVFRYRVPSTSSAGKVVPCSTSTSRRPLRRLGLSEEYADGRTSEGDNGGGIADLADALRHDVRRAADPARHLPEKYHAGEVGVGTASMLFVCTFGLLIIADIAITARSRRASGMGAIDARLDVVRRRSASKFLLFIDCRSLRRVPRVGGRRERTRANGGAIASRRSKRILRRDPLNATVGRSVMRGLLTAPASRRRGIRRRRRSRSSCTFAYPSTSAAARNTSSTSAVR